ncbi:MULTISPECIES: hypothetical protein [unclassified Streptomyces]|uniref:hypothetical protein n=1 Tax=unclassified Streptomyces TaxID=2593676 RepID=UPI001FD409AC|nr:MULTISPECIES: hypothetical protein [unclassified Streptomyces]MDH3033989.1 hypothetical protein [Streptomyces sp. TRM75561]
MDAALISAVHARLDAAGRRAVQNDPLERALNDFSGEYLGAARAQVPEKLSRAAAHRTALTEQARSRFSQFAMEGFAEEPKPA